MAFESRRLVFDQEELISAALDFCHHDRIPLPDAAVEHVEFITDGEPKLILFFRVGCPMEPDQIVLSGAQLVDALARFCKRKEIPLPRTPDKSLRCESGRVVLQFEMLHRIHCENAAVSA
jgi:hypothetical protein